MFFLCDTFISMCIAPSSFQTKDSPSRKIGGQIDKVILAQNTAGSRSNTETHTCMRSTYIYLQANTHAQVCSHLCTHVWYLNLGAGKHSTRFTHTCTHTGQWTELWRVKRFGRRGYGSMGWQRLLLSLRWAEIFDCGCQHCGHRNYLSHTAVRSSAGGLLLFRGLSHPCCDCMATYQSFFLLLLYS